MEKTEGSQRPRQGGELPTYWRSGRAALSALMQVSAALGKPQHGGPAAPSSAGQASWQEVLPQAQQVLRSRQRCHARLDRGEDRCEPRTFSQKSNRMETIDSTPHAWWNLGPSTDTSAQRSSAPSEWHDAARASGTPLSHCSSWLDHSKTPYNVQAGIWCSLAHTHPLLPSAWVPAPAPLLALTAR